MAGRSKWKERYRAYAKVFKQNWELYKASRIGLVGIAIIIFFLLMALSAPYLGLRDPIGWFAPDEDIIAVDQYHPPGIDTGVPPYNVRTTPITEEITFRLRPKSEEPRTDRVYVTTDDHIYAIRPITGIQNWLFPGNFTADGTITTPVVVINFGHHTEPDKADFVLYFGTEQGTLYALNDSNTQIGNVPVGQNAFSVALDGSPVESVAAYSLDIEAGRRGSVRIEQDNTPDLDGVDTPFAVDLGGSFQIYYSGNNSEEDRWGILSLSSRDGLRFVRGGSKGANDVFSTPSLWDGEGEMDPYVFQDSLGSWLMYYVGFDGSAYRILRATSPDRLDWTKAATPVLSSSRPEDAAGMRRPWLVREPGLWTLLYAGYDGTMWRLLSATSTDDGANWSGPSVVLDDARHPTVYEPEPGSGNYTMVYTANVSGAPRLFETTSMDPGVWSPGVEIVGPGDALRLVDTGHPIFDPLSLEAQISQGAQSPMVLPLEDGSFRMYYVSPYFEQRAGGEDMAAIVTQTSPDGLMWIREHKDLYVATTQAGWVYAFSAVDNQLLWQRKISDLPTRVSGTPLIPANDPTYSSAFDRDGAIVVVGTQDGEIHGLRTRDGVLAWEDPFHLGLPEGGTWWTPPVVAEQSAIPIANGTDFTDVAYAASSDGWLYAVFVKDGQLIPHWKDSASGWEREIGIPVRDAGGDLDLGNLSAPSVRGTTLYVGSSTGRAYALYRDNVGLTIKAGDTKWEFGDEALRDKNATFAIRPTNWNPLDLVFFVANHDNGTENDPTDDRSAVYSIALDGEISWKQNFEGHVAGPVIVWRSEEPVSGTQGQLQPAVWFGTDHGIVYAYSAAGKVIAPLPPTWLRPVQSGNVYWLGTDDRGRDLFSQLMYGAQIALIVGFLAAFFSISIGVIIGLVAGYSGGRVESILMRFTDVILVLPGLPLVIILAAVLGANIWNIIFVIAIVGWPGVARVIRAEVLSLKERPFIDSARVTGASNIRIMFRHVAPNILPLAFLYMTFAVSGAILTEAALSFIGLGDVNTPSWGQMLEAIQRANVLGSWWWLLPPGLGITFLSLAFYLVGRGYEQIVNPRLRAR